jgi:hypothetical protein|uniref:Uncharacterized protein n=1 Tax=Bacillus thuringiensis subsp. israelensis TaxID=1430 RepID=Q8KNW2_BACTI|nr:hypothetical protein [Bacillus thuringiensis serovar israelensis]CAD30078.1 hypothetical protein [Bacillus thuringiensis serovar israelensis]
MWMCEEQILEKGECRLTHDFGYNLRMVGNTTSIYTCDITIFNKYSY